MAKPIEVNALYKKIGKDAKFQGFEVRIGERVFAPAIGYLRVSEVPALEAMLVEAYSLGQQG